MTALRLVDVTVTLHGRVLVGPVNAEVAPGAVLAVTGPSGCGKSSLLQALAGLAAPPLQATGGLWLGEVPLHALPVEARRLGLMFQDDLLFPHMTVLDNLLFAMPAGRRADRVARAEAALTEAGLADHTAHRPHQLSGGQRQRVALLRTLLAAPRALLLDEPFSRLDAARRAAMRAVVWQTLARHGLPAVLVTHDPADIPPNAQVLALGDADA
ncbi:ATP-binding cassette domain-containing protein [Sphaerotilus sp.]|uniref:ATP-binding cassette domain-containing protein n=1 Tax=Sphaerotilus sp. TaxID=2093942 RepID=UPI002ACEE39B|nr:ATP-binding cassette domain-containing protein [Sphaerotilus sp.]MDZ7855665.1 ATP-binding cassette domain-containing protein [Sphaerotilus sp.]